MLEVAQHGLATCVVSENGLQVTEFMRLPEAPCVVEGTRYRMARNGQSFTLDGPFGVLAVAERSGRREYTISGAGHQFQLRRIGMLGQRWEVHVDGRLAGTCSLGTLSCSGDLPAEMPLALRVFVLYATLMSGAGKFLPWA